MPKFRVRLLVPFLPSSTGEEGTERNPLQSAFPEAIGPYHRQCLTRRCTESEQPDLTPFSINKALSGHPLYSAKSLS